MTITNPNTEIEPVRLTPYHPAEHQLALAGREGTSPQTQANPAGDFFPGGCNV